MFHCCKYRLILFSVCFVKLASIFTLRFPKCEFIKINNAFPTKANNNVGVIPQLFNF